MDYSDSVDIAVPCEIAFAAISDLTSMGKYSPENTGGSWTRGARGPALGARFRGTNSNGKIEWTTTVRVTEFHEPSEFAFAVSAFGLKVATWAYRIEATPTGCRVTETWTDQRGRIVASQEKTTTPDRLGFVKTSIRQTLDSLKDALEAK